MGIDINKAKGHPFFIAFRGANVKAVDKNETQLADVAKAKDEVTKDTQYDDKKSGGEGGKG